MGLVVSKKVGKAHDRNRVKRRVREYFRSHRALFREPVEIVVVAKRGAASLSMEEFHAELEAVLGAWQGQPPSAC